MAALGTWVGTRCQGQKPGASATGQRLHPGIVKAVWAGSLSSASEKVNGQAHASVGGQPPGCCCLAFEDGDSLVNVQLGRHRVGLLCMRLGNSGESAVGTAVAIGTRHRPVARTADHGREPTGPNISSWKSGGEAGAAFRICLNPTVGLDRGTGEGDGICRPNQQVSLVQSSGTSPAVKPET